MATITKPFTEDEYTSNKSTWTVTLTGTNQTVSGSTFNFIHPTCKAKYVGSNKGYGSVKVEFTLAYPNSSSMWMSCGFSKYENTYGKLVSGTEYTIPENQYWGGSQVRTSYLFGSVNKTSRTVDLIPVSGTWCIELESMNSSQNYYNMYRNTNNIYYWNAAISTITLDAPPIVEFGTPTYNTPHYNSLGAYSVRITTASAQYGGDISSITLTIGNDSVTQTYSNPTVSNQTLSLVPTQAGIFVPTITVTDSRGQKTTASFDSITVNPYITNVSNLIIDRVKSTTPDQFSRLDEGTNAVLSTKFNYSQDIGGVLIAPTITISDGTTTNNNPTITWYTSWDPSTGQFGNEVISSNASTNQVLWSSINDGTILYGKITDSLSQDNSYTISIQPHSTINNITKDGETQTIILPKSFFLLVGRSGGKGLGIGKKPEGDYLDIGMMTHLEQDINIGQYYDNSQQSYAFTIGNGTSDIAPSNALVVDWLGNVETAGDISSDNGTFSGDVTVTGDITCSNIGDRKNVYGNSSTSNVNNSAGVYVTIGVLEHVPNGLWIVNCRARFIPNTGTTGNNYPAIYITTSSSGEAWHQRTYTAGTTNAQLNATEFLELSDANNDNSIYLRGTNNQAGYWTKQNAAQFIIDAIRIK